jgi:flagellin-specific chaperone FliS
MSIAFYLIGTLLATGIYLNKSGKQPRKLNKQRQHVNADEKPSDKNIYHSERYYDAWRDEFDKATISKQKSLDTINSNIVQRYSNEMSTNQEMSPELQSYLEKRGSRFKYYQEKTEQKNMINEGGNEMQIEESPMFSAFGNDNVPSGGLQNFKDENPEDVLYEKFQCGNRSQGNDSPSMTKQEHFGMFTLHGPRNSNNPMTHNNMVPFFKGHIKQNMDPMAKQTLMENFTGQTNAPTEFRAQPKREIPSLQDRTPGQTYIYGTPADNVYQRDRYWTSTLKNDITPIEQVRVGPGISGTFDSKPRDGFHTMWRPPTRNVDELRVNPKNVYEGRLLPGQELVKNRGIEGEVFKQRPDTFYINDPRRWNLTTGSYTGPAIRENFVANKQNREDTTIAYTGIAGSDTTEGPYVGICMEDGGECDPNHEKPDCPPLVTQAKHTDRQQLPRFGDRNFGQTQVLKPEKYFYDKARPTTKETTHVIDYQGIAGNESDIKQQQYLYDKARPTIKEGTHVMGYMGQVKNESQQKTQKYLYDKARPTIKEGTHVMGYMGQVQNESQQKTQKYLYDKARPTIKEGTHVMGYMGQVQNESQQKTQKYLYDKARPTIKEGTHVMGYMGQIQSESQQKTQKYLYDKARPTTKETTHVEGYMGQIGEQANIKQQKYLYDKARPTIKETTHVMGYQGQAGEKANVKQQKYLYDKARPTTKETTHVIDYQGQAGSGQTEKQQKYFYDKARPTTKETTHVIDYQGQAGSGQTEKQMKYLYDKARTTTKETTHVIDYTGQAGTAQITIPTSYEAMYNATTNNNSESLLESRTYGPNKNTNITVGACDVNIQIKQRAGYDITKYGTNEDRLYTAIPNIGANYQKTTSRNQQFERNPYTQSLNSAPRVTSPFVRGETPFQNC